jgi:hypothetical protein
MESNHDLYLLLGRLDGKVDTLVTLHSATQQRLDAIEQRLGHVEQDTASLKSSGTSSKTWTSNIMSVVAVIIAAIGTYIGFKG